MQRSVELFEIFPNFSLIKLHSKRGPRSFLVYLPLSITLLQIFLIFTCFRQNHWTDSERFKQLAIKHYYITTRYWYSGSFSSISKGKNMRFRRRIFISITLIKFIIICFIYFRCTSGIHQWLKDGFGLLQRLFTVINI